MVVVLQELTVVMDTGATLYQAYLKSLQMMEFTTENGLHLPVLAPLVAQSLNKLEVINQKVTVAPPLSNKEDVLVSNFSTEGINI